MPESPFTAAEERVRLTFFSYIYILISLPLLNIYMYVCIIKV